MRTALRKMGNSAGMIIPKPIITESRSEIGTEFEIEVRDHAIVATPLSPHPRAGWEAEMRGIAEEEQIDRAWIDTPTGFEAEWEW